MEHSQRAWPIESPQTVAQIIIAALVEGVKSSLEQINKVKQNPQIFPFFQNYSMALEMVIKTAGY